MNDIPQPRHLRVLTRRAPWGLPNLRRGKLTHRCHLLPTHPTGRILHTERIPRTERIPHTERTPHTERIPHTGHIPHMEHIPRTEHIPHTRHTPRIKLARISIKHKISHRDNNTNGCQARVS